MRSAVESDRRANSGFVLVAVLWMLAALAALASIYSTYAINTADASHVADDRVQAEASVRAGVEMAVLQQLAVPEPARPSHGAFDLRVGRTRVLVSFRPETARVDLNAAPANLLAALFSAVGGDSAHAGAFADRVVGWRTKAEANVVSKEAKLYADQRVPYPPRQAPFDSALELSLLPGIPRAVVERILPFVTVFSGKPKIDVATADPALLSALPGMTPQILNSVLKARAKNRVDGQELLGLLGPAKDHATVDKSQAIRAAVEVRFDNGRRVEAEVVFRLKEGLDEPYDIVYWRDDFDDPMEAE
ncbi:MAG: general secretion pathway protein GspK [Hyphomicrobiales bacterium]|nr:general secretion pathway protein GspK [Hyphomicrobiales bacterium]